MAPCTRDLHLKWAAQLTSNQKSRISRALAGLAAEESVGNMKECKKEAEEEGLFTFRGESYA